MTELIASAVAGYLGTALVSMTGLLRWNVEGAIALAVSAYAGRAFQAGAFGLGPDGWLLVLGWYGGALAGLALAEALWHRA